MYFQLGTTEHVTWRPTVSGVTFKIFITGQKCLKQNLWRKMKHTLWPADITIWLNFITCHKWQLQTCPSIHCEGIWGHRFTASLILNLNITEEHGGKIHAPATLPCRKDWTGNWVGLKDSLDTLQKRKSSWSCWESSPKLSSTWPGDYTD